MPGSMLDKYAPARHYEAGSNAEEQAGGLDDFGAFGFLRGIHDRALMLELRLKSGRMLAFGYAWLDHAEFDPSDGITLYFGGRQVKIVGRNLNAEVRSHVRLFEAIARHKVPWIQEADEPTILEAPRGTVVIEQITMKP